MAGKRLSKAERVTIGYIGFICGKPHFDMSIDSYGTVRSADLFKNRREARARYEDVRKVEVREVEP